MIHVLDISFIATVLCGIDICNYHTCPNIPQAKYKMDICNECHGRQVGFNLLLQLQGTIIFNDTEVTGECSKYYINILTTCTVVSLSLFFSHSNM